VTLPPTIWLLDASIADPDRRQALFPRPFDETVAELCNAVSVKATRSERMKSWSGPSPLPQRVSVVLEVCQGNLVDVFHNSAAGVRAQCLHTVELGTSALEYARDRLREKAVQLIQARPHGAIPKDLIAQSLGQSSTMVWIHQGHWVRHARMADRQLRIAQWEAHEQLRTQRKGSSFATAARRRTHLLQLT
jgi:hypothetical protein